MLSSMISEKLIRIDVEAVDWKEAIRASAQPLLAEDKITQEYIDKIIEIAEGPGRTLWWRSISLYRLRLQSLGQRSWRWG